jgi:hypothetical protein
MTLEIETVAVDDLALDPENARKHSEQNLAAITASLEQFGQRRPLVVYGDVVIAGNGTLQAARSLGWETVSVTKVPDDWTVDQAKAYAIADNRSAELAHWDQVALLDSLVELDESLLTATGFDGTDIENLLTLTAAPDLDDLFDSIGDPTEEDNMTRVSFVVPVDVAAKWEHAVKNAGSGSPLENLCTVIQAAFEAIVDDS